MTRRPSSSRPTNGGDHRLGSISLGQGRSLEVSIVRRPAGLAVRVRVLEGVREVTWFVLPASCLDDLLGLLAAVRAAVVAARGAGATWRSSAPWGTWAREEKGDAGEMPPRFSKAGGGSAPTAAASRTTCEPGSRVYACRGSS